MIQEFVKEEAGWFLLALCFFGEQEMFSFSINENKI
jgi:hypothetical protein